MFQEPESPIRVSASGVKAFKDCPYKYAVNYLTKLPSTARASAPALSFGTAIHRAIAQFLRCGGWERQTVDDLVALLMRYWDVAAFADEATSYTEFERGREMLEVFFHARFPAVVARELEVEPFVAWTEHRRGIQASGRFDMTCVLPNKHLLVVDWKTGARGPIGEDLTADVQAVFYHALASDRYSQVPHDRITIAFAYLDGAAASTVTFEADEFETRWTAIETVVQHIRRDRRYFERGLPLEEAFPPRPGAQCRWCDARLHCERKGHLAGGAA